MAASLMRRFLFPELNRSFLFRVLFVILGAVVVFTQLLVPLRIEGHSMEPTYADGGFTFCWRGRYWLAEPARGDVVVIRFAGRQVTLLKRVVALAGETVEFQDGVLLVNGERVAEPYVNNPARWNLAPRTVEAGKVYVVGDNRSVPIERHHMGQVERERILGGVLW